jgi:hypothetical protein
MLEALALSGIEKGDWVGILKTDSSAAAIAAGKFPDMLQVLAASGIQKSDWVGILTTDSSAAAIRAGQFPALFQNLKSAGIPASSWIQFLNKGCTVVALTAGTIAGGTTLAEYKEKLGAHGIQDIHLHRIMNNKTTTEAIRGGRLPEMIARLKKETSIPTEKWYGILAIRSSSKALLDDTFGNMILMLRSTGIQPEHFYKILSSDTVASMLLEDKPAFQRVIESLRLSGMDVGTWHTMLYTKPVVGAISKGALPKIIRNLNLAHCHKNGWHTRIITDLATLCKLTCVCTPVACVCRCQTAGVSKGRSAPCVCECRTHSPSVVTSFESGDLMDAGVARPQDSGIPNQGTQNPIDTVLERFREARGLPAPPPPPPPQ